MADRPNDRESTRRNQSGSSSNAGDSEEALERALERKTEDLAGDIEQNRNLSGSTTYETLREQGDLDVASPDRDEST